MLLISLSMSYQSQAFVIIYVLYLNANAAIVTSTISKYNKNVPFNHSVVKLLHKILSIGTQVKSLDTKVIKMEMLIYVPKIENIQIIFKSIAVKNRGGGCLCI